MSRVEPRDKAGLDPAAPSRGGHEESRCLTPAPPRSRPPPRQPTRRLGRWWECVWWGEVYVSWRVAVMGLGAVERTTEAELSRSLAVVEGVTGRVIVEVSQITVTRRSGALEAERGASAYCGTGSEGSFVDTVGVVEVVVKGEA